MKFAHWLASCAMAVALAACGGGGGGGGGGGDSAGITPPTIIGLVPLAPALGATITADAAVFRPLRDSAVWKYQGLAKASAAATAVSYVTSTTHVSVTGTSATENFSNGGNTGADTQPISISGGTVGWQQSIDFAGKGVPENLQFVELRSPVRQGDQYTILDKRYTDTNIDADGDRKPDALDVALYARVIGTETLALPNLPALTTVRVDTTLRTRVIYSSDGKASPVTEVLVQTWYARGIGIVRQRTTSPTPSSNDVKTTDEQLVSWDGINAGFGAMDPRPAVIPASSAALPGQGLQRPTSQDTGVAFDNHVLVFSPWPGNVFDTLATRIDLRGNVLGARQLSNLSVSSFGRLVRMANNAHYLQQVVDGNQTQLAMTRFDSDGVLQGVSGGVRLDLAGTRFVPRLTRFEAAADGSTLWVLWQRAYVNVGVGFVDELVLRPWSADGLPLAAEMVVESSAVSNVALSAGGGQVLLSWQRIGATTTDVRYASATVAGGLVGPKTLAGGFTNSNSFVLPLRLDTTGALLWMSQLGTGQSLPRPAGVRLDASLDALRSSTALDGELLGQLPLNSTVFIGSSFGDATARSLGSRIVVSTRTGGFIGATGGATPAMAAVSLLDAPPTRALATQPAAVVQRSWDGPALQFLFADRLLVIGTLPGGTTVVWLNAGQAP